MTYIDPSVLILLVLAGICYVFNNNTVTYAILVLLLFKLTPLQSYFPLLHRHGMTVGIVILTAAMLVPIATNKISISLLIQSFKNWESIVAIVIGILVSWLGTRGVSLMSSQPLVITGLIIGTIIGTTFFKGIPVGPLIAAGIVSLLIVKI